MNDEALDWARRLLAAAPLAPVRLVRMLAHVLAGRARSDALLIMADALDEFAADSVVIFPHEATAMRQLGDVLRDEAPRRA